LALLASLVTVSRVAAKPPSDDGQAAHQPHGAHPQLTVHRRALPDLAAAVPITDPSTGTYSSIPCNQPAPFNDVALDLTPDFPGVQDPAPVRHFVGVTVTPTEGNQGTVEGEITSILCVGGEESNNHIFTSSRGRTSRPAAR
jgi:hypothetical protein